MTLSTLFCCLVAVVNPIFIASSIAHGDAGFAAWFAFLEPFLLTAAGVGFYMDWMNA